MENKTTGQSRVEKLLRKEAGSLKRPMLLVSAAVYAALVGVVIYGANDHVYDGFGSAAPWIVGGIFALMSVLRLAEYLYTLKRSKEVRSYLDSRANPERHPELEEDSELEAVLDRYNVTEDDR